MNAALALIVLGLITIAAALTIDLGSTIPLYAAGIILIGYGVFVVEVSP
jgi:hypothetical protein